MTLSLEATTLLGRARQAEHAADLYLGDERVEPARFAEILREVDPSQLDERVLWNVLFAAGELSQRVDVYRAHELFVAAHGLVQRAGDLDPERAATIEMSFDFFFGRKAHPLLPLRAKEIVSSLGALLNRSRAERRAGIHGLGHLIALGRGQAWTHDAVQLLDELVRQEPSAELRRYAEQARTGELA